MSHVMLGHTHLSTSGGLHAGDDGVSYTAPTAMWVKAFDVLLSKLKEVGFPFARVAAISGCGQVYIHHIWQSACAMHVTIATW